MPEPEYPERDDGRANGSRGNGSAIERPRQRQWQSRRDARFAPTAPAPPAADEDDWLSLGDDDFEPGSLSPLRERNDGPAGPPTPGEARNFAKEARRRASRRPSSILDLDEERARLEREEAEEAEVDFESVLEHQPQKSGVARRGSAIRHAFQGGIQSLRRVGGERIAESRDRVQALRERVPARIPQPGTADGGGAGKPPPPRLPRRISSRRPRKPKPGRVKKLRLLIVLLGLGLLAIVSTFFGMMMAIAQDLPQLENKKEFAEAEELGRPRRPGQQDRDSDSTTTSASCSTPTRSPPTMKQAAVAIEDKRFYEHGGVDFQGMARAAIADVVPGGSTQGASTITQQFVKNALEAQGSRTVFEKFREAALAYQLERHWDKDKILTEYLNTIYFGEGAYGIEAAAHTYFGWNHPGCGSTGHDPCASRYSDPQEAAMLAGIIASPSAFSPRANPQAAMDRRNLVLQKMLDQGDITQRASTSEELAHPLPAASEIQPPDRRLRRPPTSPPGCASRSSTCYGAGRAFGGGLPGPQHARPRHAEHGAGDRPEHAGRGRADRLGGRDRQRDRRGEGDGRRQRLREPSVQPGDQRPPPAGFVVQAVHPGDRARARGSRPSTTYASNEKIFKVPRSKHEYFDVHNYNDEYFGSSSLDDGDAPLGQLGLRRARAGPDDSGAPRDAVEAPPSAAARSGSPTPPIEMGIAHRSSRPTPRWSSAPSTRA